MRWLILYWWCCSCLGTWCTAHNHLYSCSSLSYRAGRYSPESRYQRCNSLEHTKTTTSEQLTGTHENTHQSNSLGHTKTHIRATHWNTQKHTSEKHSLKAQNYKNITWDYWNLTNTLCSKYYYIHNFKVANLYYNQSIIINAKTFKYFTTFYGQHIASQKQISFHNFCQWKGN